MKNTKSEPLKTVLTITLGFMAIFLLTGWKWAAGISLGVGIAGLFSAFLAKQIDFLWMKLAHILSLIVPNIILGMVFYVFLFPISLLARAFGKKDPLFLKKPATGTYRTVEKAFDKEGFEKPW
ncbi:MAG: SxtJ family membrane protein [Flavobacteriales bacterium]|nr:SxtJ family membrane protein [Flavobacteriales bacterium]